MFDETLYFLNLFADNSIFESIVFNQTLSFESTVILILPDNFDKLDKHLQESIKNYLNQLNTIEKKAYKIAKEHLGSSFNLVKSNGYCDWIKENK